VTTLAYQPEVSFKKTEEFSKNIIIRNQKARFEIFEKL
jgi:hypothetical protein